MRRYVLLLSVLLLCSCARVSVNQRSILGVHQFDRPCSTDTQNIIIMKKIAYEHAYDTQKKVAVWTAYRYDYTTKTLERVGSWHEDTSIPKQFRSTSKDYEGLYKKDLTGYDKGHQCPDAVAKEFGSKAEEESFLYSNATPQVSKVNQQIWNKLEAWARDQADRTAPVYVITGPIFAKNSARVVVGPNNVSVPNAYFMIISKGNMAHFYVKAVIVFNIPENKGMVVSIKDIEKLTGWDFFINDSNPASSIEEKK